jgi:hypothetical protein
MVSHASKMSVPMSINHPNITSLIYELVKTIEFDIELDTGFTLRIELLRSISESRRFRAHIWGTEFFRLQSTFPQDAATERPAHEPSDEIILVDYSHLLSRKYEDFESETVESAAQSILDDCKKLLVHATGQGSS